MPIPHDAIIFDCDGTLTDTESSWNRAYRHLFARYGVPLDPGIRMRLASLGRSDLGHALAGLLGHPASPDVLGSTLYDLVRTNAGAGVRALEGAVELVTALHGTRPLAIATNTPAGIVTGYLDDIGLRAAFDIIVDSARAGAPKPAPAPYQHACELLHVDPARAIAVEDSATGTRAARAAGLYIIGIPSRPGLDIDADLRAASLLAPAVWTALGLPAYTPGTAPASSIT
jgi:HAD superfamily hydrolase (TIGR01509 family)